MFLFIKKEICNLFCIYVKSNLILYTLLQVHNVEIQKDKDTKDTCEDAKMIKVTGHAILL